MSWRRPLSLLMPISALSFVFGCSPQLSRELDYSNTGTAAVSTNKLGLALYRNLMHGEGNFCFSPMSIAMGLSSSLSGARATTAEELRAVLGLPADSDVHESFRALRVVLQQGSSRNCRANLANALMYQKGLDLKTDFMSALHDNYASEIFVAELDRNPHDACDRMNAWIFENTDGRIEQLLDSSDVGGDTRVILTSALSFDARWQNVFDKKETKETPFHLEDGTTVSVPMMFQSSHVSYLYNDDVMLVRLPYSGERVEMVLVLPAGGERLADVEEKISIENIQGWLDGCDAGNVMVLLPRFTSKATIDLNEPLSALGMPCAFNVSCADFSGITDESLYISLVKHGCYVEVSEEATKVGAANAIVMPASAASEPFRADRPFLYFIRDKGSGAILVVGRVMDPRV